MPDDGLNGAKRAISDDIAPANDAADAENESADKRLADTSEDAGDATPDVAAHDDAPRDPLDGLAARAADDPGAPFEPGTVAALFELRCRDRAGYERILAKLRKIKVRTAELDRAVKVKAVAPKGETVTDAGGANSAADEASDASADEQGIAGDGATIKDPPPEPNDAIIGRLAKLNTLEYERCREAEAKGLNVRASILDRLVNAARPHDDAAHGRFLVLRDPESWPEPVSLAELLLEIRAAILRHVILSADAATVIALWAAHTWLYEHFEHTPRLAITSPTKRCGKTTLVTLLLLLCRRALKADNISAAGTFRLVEALHPLTLLLDEADSFLRENEELRGVLNSGYEKSGMVVRVVEVNEEQRPVQFMTFAPLALAGIRRMPETIEDRSIPVRLARKAATETTRKLRERGMRPALLTLARKLARWAADDGAKVGTEPAIPVTLNDRQGDISVPLLAIADTAGPEWASRARKALLAVFGASAAEGDHETGIVLLEDIQTLFSGTSATRMSSDDIVKHLGEMEDRPWPEWRHDKPMTKAQLAVALRPFGIRPGNLKMPDGKVVKGYPRDAFAEAWERYLDADSANTDPKGGSRPLPRYFVERDSKKSENRAATENRGSGCKNGEKHSHSNESSGVADRPPPRPHAKDLNGWEGTIQ